MQFAPTSQRMSAQGRFLAQMAPFLKPPSARQGAGGTQEELAALPKLQLFAVIDSARDPQIFDELLERQNRLEIVSLYQGESADELADVAPYLIEIGADSPETSWLFERGWGESWFILVLAYGDIDAVRRHLRKFTMVWTEAGESLLFRFYDPRVLRIFLPTCSAAQLAELFGTMVLRFFTEDVLPDQALMFERDADGASLIRLPITLAPLDEGRRA